MLRCKIDKIYNFKECNLKYNKVYKLEYFNIYCIRYLLKINCTFFMLNLRDKNCVRTVFVNNVIFKYDSFDFLQLTYKLYIIFCNGYFLKTNISKDYLTISYRDNYVDDFFKIDFFSLHNTFKNSNNDFLREDIFLNFNNIGNELVYIFDVSDSIYNAFTINNKLFINILPNVDIEFIYTCCSKDIKSSVYRNINIFVFLDINVTCRYFVDKKLNVNSILYLDLKVIQSSYTFFYCFFLNLDSLHTKFILRIFSRGTKTKSISHIIFIGSFIQIFDFIYDVKISNNKNNNHMGLRVVLEDFSICLFNGLVTVHPYLLGIKVNMVAEALMLSKNSVVNFKPQLDIQSKFVKCRHSAGTYFLKYDEVFYICSRGVSRDKANNILLICYLIEFLQCNILSNISSKYIRSVIMKGV